MKSIFVLFVLALIVNGCTSEGKKYVKIEVEGKVFEVSVNSNILIQSIIDETEFKTFLIGFSFENTDSLLQVIPLETNCIPSSKKNIYFFKKDDFLFLFTDTLTLTLVFNRYVINPVSIKRRYKLKDNCIDNDCPMMLFSYSNGQFNKIKGFYW